MTRHERFHVRVAPEVYEAIDLAADPRERVRFYDAIDRLARFGTRAPGAKKSRKLRMSRLRTIERRVQRWRRLLEDER
jgi:hypothetical protein